MAGKWIIGTRKPSTISDWKKLIRNFRDDFPYDPLTALIVETFANAVDSKATRIDIQVSSNSEFIITDNGTGMSEDTFIEYHNIASMTKTRGATIGFAGVGAKVFLDRSESIVTETRSKGFQGATHWAFYGESLEWTPIEVKNRVKNKTGTYVCVKINTPEDVGKLSVNFVMEVLKRQYNAILSGHYTIQTVTVNGRIIREWKIPKDQIEYKKQFNFKLNKRQISGFIIKSLKPLPEEYQGPFIIVHGKTVKQEWFRQYPIGSDKFYGLIFADYLIEILRTSKSDFERTSMLWKKFCSQMGNFIGKWLDEIGAKPKANMDTDSLVNLSQEIEKSINQVLKLPEFAPLAKNLFQNKILRDIAIASNQGTKMGSETDGVQETEGTKGNGNNSSGTPTEGDDEGTGFTENREGNVPIEVVSRRVKGLIRIGFDDKPQDFLEGWIDSSQKAVIVNTGHPSWKVAEGFSIQAKVQHVIIYHILRTVLTTIVDEMTEEANKETLTKLFSSWYDSCIRD
jgi:hypothetical protein